MIWYPYEQMKTMRPPYEIIDAKGVYLYTKDQQLIDSISSWWSVIHGYKHPLLTEAIKNQADHFSHVMLGGLTHEPVKKLSRKLEEWLPGDLDYCFFFRFRQCGGGSGVKNGAAVLHKPGKKPG